MRPRTEEQRGKRACALTARGSICKAPQTWCEPKSRAQSGVEADTRKPAML